MKEGLFRRRKPVEQTYLRRRGDRALSALRKIPQATVETGP